MVGFSDIDHDLSGYAFPSSTLDPRSNAFSDNASDQSIKAKRNDLKRYLFRFFDALTTSLTTGRYTAVIGSEKKC
jgi:hypothetical protein